MDVGALRNILYEILTAEDEGPSSINATQQMGVSLSNAVKKDGVMIVQLQSVVNKVIVKKVVEALTLLDGPTDEVEALPYPETVDQFLDRHLEEGYSLVEIKKLISRMYAQAAVEKYDFTGSTCRRLGIRPTTMRRLTNG